jgi:hypothetical protein
MRRPSVNYGCVVVALIGCQTAATSGDEASEGALVVRSADPASAIEARYSEGEHALVLRAQPDGAAFKSELIDERGRDVTRLASSILERTPVRTPTGDLTVPVHGLFENARTLRTALQLSRHGLRQLRDTVSVETADSGAFRHLLQQTAVLRKALIQTRLALLQEWGNEARRNLTLTSDEHAKFFAILNRQAAAIVATPGRGRTSAHAASSMDAELAQLLGPERHAQYQHRRKTWLAPAGEDTLEVVP